MSYGQLTVGRDGAVATVRMNNPAKLNALSDTMTGELLDALGQLVEDPNVRAVILTGEGRAFSAGADLSALREPYLKGERPQLSLLLRGGYNRLVAVLAEAPKPVIAAINGVTAGAGVSLALACDLRIAAEEATFNLAFVRIGLVPDSGASYLLPRAVGTARALELALSGETIDSTTALQMGLVSRVVPAGQTLQEAVSLAGRLAELPTTAIGLTKVLFNQASRLTLAEAMEREAELQDRAAATEDHLEGVLAFLQKRDPHFTGR